MNELDTRLEKLGITLGLAFNFNDRKRLSETTTDEELLEEHRKIMESISGVQRANLATNHSNFN